MLPSAADMHCTMKADAHHAPGAAYPAVAADTGFAAAVPHQSEPPSLPCNSKVELNSGCIDAIYVWGAAPQTCERRQAGKHAHLLPHCCSCCSCRPFPVLPAIV